MSDTNAVDALIQALRRLPGVGVKSAQRMAFHLLQHDRAGAQTLARALQEASSHVHHCERCHTFTESTVCATCRDARRDHSQLCVVETPADQAAMERTGAYKGLYFVLMGRLSPLDGIGLADIGVHPLLDRASDEQVREVMAPMRPQRVGSMGSTSGWATLKKPFRLTSITRCHCSGRRPANTPSSCTPALWTST